MTDLGDKLKALRQKAIDGGMVPGEIDAHDPAGMASYLRERARVNRELADIPVDQWPRYPGVAQHVALRLDQAADMIERRLASDTSVLENVQKAINAIEGGNDVVLQDDDLVWLRQIAGIQS